MERRGPRYPECQSQSCRISGAAEWIFSTRADKELKTELSLEAGWGKALSQGLVLGGSLFPKSMLGAFGYKVLQAGEAEACQTLTSSAPA